MIKPFMAPESKGTLFSVGLLMTALLLTPSTAGLAQDQVLTPEEFELVADEGFGDPHNTTAWSMIWWNGELFVGTNRQWMCWSVASIVKAYPFLSFLYPPPHPLMDCAPDPVDLDLQAEIWRLTPETNIWSRVYQAPASVPLPEDPTKFTARDVGYRGMGLFQETGMPEALFVSGVTGKMVNDNAGPPRILRSTDGFTFDPLPQDPGTFLGDFDKNSFRGVQTYKGRLYIVGSTVQGSGVLLEAESPAQGNDAFRQVSPEGMLVWDICPYNGYLYVGTRDALEIFPEASSSQVQEKGYRIWKTDAEGAPPYEFIPVVTHGGYLPEPSRSPVSIFEFKGRLYVGTDKPAELIRINPDDTWDLIAGAPRETPEGFRFPLSGMGAGFNWPYNIHMWAMSELDGVLYVGTADNTSRMLNLPLIGALLEPFAGFDLYGSADGVFWTRLTINGFNNKHHMGIRTFASTPEGLFFGTNNFWGGLHVWRGRPSGGAVAPPTLLVAENSDPGVVLSWNPERPSTGTRIHVYRAEGVRTGELALPAPFVEIGVSSDSYFVDPTANPNKRYEYYVVSEDSGGRVSGPSNIAPAPSLAPPVSFSAVADRVAKWDIEEGHKAALLSQLNRAGAMAQNNDPRRIQLHLRRLKALVTRHRGAYAWRAEDLDLLLNQLTKRVRLARLGLLSYSGLD